MAGSFLLEKKVFLLLHRITDKVSKVKRFFLRKREEIRCMRNKNAKFFAFLQEKRNLWRIKDVRKGDV